MDYQIYSDSELDSTLASNEDSLTDEVVERKIYDVVKEMKDELLDDTEAPDLSTELFYTEIVCKKPMYAGSI